jgi:uncharacterized protein
VAPVFVDTWGWLTLADPREPAHAAVVALRQQHAAQRIPWITTDYILDETLTRVFQRVPFARARHFADGIFSAHKAGVLGLEFITPERFASAYQLRLKFEDKPSVSFTDLTSFAVMKELRLQQAITGDAHYEQVNLGFVRLPSA